MLSTFVDVLSIAARSLLERDGILSSPLYWTILANGDADFHDNLIFFGFHAEQSDPVLVAKVPRLVENGWMLKTEYDHLIELWSCMGEPAAQYIPKPYSLTTLQERPVLMISYVPGESLTRLSRRSFWGHPGQVVALARDAARSLRALNDLTESPIQERELLDLEFQKKADKFRELFQLAPTEDRALADLTATVNGMAATATHKVLIQGDFWHGNMIRDEARGKLMFIDWQFARWSPDVSMDVYLFLLAGALSATENGSVEPRAKEAFDLLVSWRANVIPEYLSAYGEPERYVLLPQREGMLMCCVEKAVRSALEFGYSHADDRLWRSLFAELVRWEDAE